MQPKNICIIPARGGSKRIPRKNIKNFLGKPIIAYSISEAVNSGLFEEVMVSTDDNEIANIAIELGATVPFLRSLKNSNDFATTFEVIEEVVNSYKKLGREFENICCIYPCAPFVVEKKIKDAYDLLSTQCFDTVFPVIRYGFPIQRSLQMNQFCKINFLYPEYALTRSQDLPPSFHDAGQFYWINVKAFLHKKMVVTSNTGSIEISELEAHDIDNEIDWKIAELKYQILKNINIY
jgi:N-acylneuraminate cytidylyltransferase